MEFIVNQPVKLAFVAVGLTTGLTSFTPRFVVNGATAVISPSYTEVGGGLYIMTFTPTVTGKYFVFIEGSIQGSFDVSNKDVYTYLRNLEDSSLGSWTWDKGTGVLTLVRQDSSTLASFVVTDTLEAASRERTS